MTKTIITLDSSQIKSYLTCPESYNLAYRLHLRRTSFWVKEYADRGTLVHWLLDRFYTFRFLNPKRDSIGHCNAAIKLLKDTGYGKAIGCTNEDIKFCEDRFRAYCFKYYNDPFRVLRSGRDLGIEVGFSVKLYEDENYIFILSGRIDLLIQLEMGGCFVDHKTRIREDKDLYGWKTQFICYAIATGFNYGMYNYIGQQATISESTFERNLHYIPNWKIEKMKEYYITDVFRPVALMIQNQKRFEFREWPQNFNSCSGANEKQPCQFAERCNENDEKRKELITHQFFEEVPKWVPY